MKILERLRSDVAFGIRQQLKTPANSIILVGTLALGIAATRTSFSLVKGFFIRPLPVHQPERLVRLYNSYANGFQYFTSSYPDFEDMRALRDVFADAALEEPAAFNLGVSAVSERIWGEYVSERYFAMLGVKPSIGRFFTTQEESGGETVHVRRRCRLAGWGCLRDDAAGHRLLACTLLLLRGALFLGAALLLRSALLLRHLTSSINGS